MKKRLKGKIELQNEKGITLIALVVTIVILIILATISIGTLFGENGLIQKTQQAKDFHEQRKNEEVKMMNELEQGYDNIINGENTVRCKGELKKIVIKWNNVDVSARPTSISIVLKKNGVKMGTYEMNVGNNWSYVLGDQGGNATWQAEVVEMLDGCTMSMDFVNSIMTIVFTGENDQGGEPVGPEEPPAGPEDPV